jgi:methyltransferase (TIGR00027 family)
MTDPILNDVSDTALWVAVYRAWETARPDALFHDPFAARLAGDRGKNIEKQMIDSRYVSWSVVIRTCIIDSYFEKLIAEGVDTVVNLGCGLDSRPYRMKLPENLRWIEIDFPHMIRHKEERLAGETPVCGLERIGLDLSKEKERRELFAKINSEARKAVVLTEGVIPYLSEQDVAALTDDLRAQSHFQFWIADYNSPDLMKYLNRPSRVKSMRNAPFLFQPSDYYGLFASHGWKQREIRYIGEESEKLGRPPPHTWFVKLMQALFLSKEKQALFKRYNGYVIFEPA